MFFLIIFISFILDFLFNFVFFDSIFLPLIVFVSLIFLEPYFIKDKYKYYLCSFLVGFFYDLVYTGYYFMNAGLFLIVAILVVFINRLTPNNFVVSFLETVLLIIFYRFLSFIFLVLNGVVFFDFKIFFECVYSSLILNVLYGSFLYLFLCFISKKFKLKRID